MIQSLDVLACAEAYADLWRDRESSAACDAIRALVRESDTAGEDAVSRARQAGHVTCGMVAIDQSRNVAMIQHKVLDRWLLPGGHVDAQDASLFAAASRELMEELGLPEDAMWPATAFLSRRETMGQTFMSHRIPFDLDVHPIPANPGKGEPAHTHYDFRWLVEIDPSRVSANMSEVKAWEMVSPFDDRVPERVRRRLLDPALSLAMLPPPTEAPKAVAKETVRQGRLAL